MTVVVDGTSGITTNSGTVVSTTDATLNGLTVGKGGGAVSGNVVAGDSALASNSTGQYNTAVGALALTTNTASGNTGLGYQALRANSTGASNTAVGGFDGTAVPPLRYNTTGSFNSALGVGALGNNTTASNNTAVGYQAGTASTTANNAYFGYIAGYTNVSGVGNAYFGSQAGANATGGSNTFVGFASGSSITTGTKNTIIGGYNGNQGSLDIRTSSNYVVLSDGDGALTYVNANGSNFFGAANTAPAPGYGVNAVLVPVYDGSSRPGMRMYNTNTGSSTLTEINFNRNGSSIGAINTTTTTTAYATSSDYRLKENITPMTGALAKVAQLKPVTYKWKLDSSDGEGFIAHELAEVCPHAVSGEKDALDKDGNPQYQGIDTSFLVATLTAAIQELKAEFDAYKASHP